MATRSSYSPTSYPQLRAPGPQSCDSKKKKALLLWCISVPPLCPTAPSQGGVKQDIGCRGLDGGGGDVRHLMVVELVPALFGGVLTVGCVMAAI